MLCTILQVQTFGPQGKRSMLTPAFSLNSNRTPIPPPSLLLGPPLPRIPPATPPGSDKEEAVVSFVGLLDSSFNKKPLPRGFTENNSPTFLSSGNPCLDFFFQVVPDTGADTVESLLSAAWAQDPLKALKLVCNLRGVRGTGKSDREGFYASALWLHSHHPQTLALNVPSLPDFGYIKDLLEILYRLIHGADARKIAKQARPRTQYDDVQEEKEKKEGSREERIAAELSRVKIVSEKAAEERRLKRIDLAARSVERYNRDPVYRFLHDRIADFFADQLASDIQHLHEGKTFEIGLAAKWCPSLDSSFDRSTLICESIARRLFPKDRHPEYAEIEEEHYAYRVRNRLRYDVLVPLRKSLQLPEVYMSSGMWDTLPYNRVASVAMRNYTDIFMKHDEKRFLEYLSEVKKGKAKIAAGALLPHKIISPLLHYCLYEEDDEGKLDCSDEEQEVAELQWQRMVQDLAEKGKLKNCIAVCDVSGSMYGTPMEVCIALGLLTSELTEDPWKGRVITFSEYPQLHKIKGKSLREKVKFIEQMNWDMNTDFQKVFDRLLEVAVEGNLDKEKMIKRIFVFSDMEFDEASKNNWGTDYEVICRKYQERGYGDCIPEIVFWKLRDSRSTPVPSTQKGVALVSGFSKNLLKIFLEGEGVLNPETAMEDAISGKEYQNLMVFD